MKKIPLTKGQFALVDDEDFEYLNQWKWYADKGKNTYYAARGCYLSGKKMKVLMHGEVCTGAMIDHIDGDGLNNQRGNLRACTYSENNRNQCVQKRSKSGYKGVTWHIRHLKWHARIKINKRIIFLGLFRDAKMAAKAYNDAALKYHGEFARLNKLE